MNPKKDPQENAPGPYTLELDEALLEQAVAAVEQHSARRPRPPSAASQAHPAHAASRADRPVPPTPRHAAPPPEVEIEIPLDDSAGERVDDLPTEEPGLDLGRMAVEWDRLVAELDQVRMERDAARRQLESEVRERARLAVRVKRLSEQVDQAQDAVNRAEEIRRNAEQDAQKARDEVRNALEGVGRMRERLRRSEDEHKTFGHAPMILTLLPVLENLERASGHSGASVERVQEGLRMIVEQFRDALRRVGVTRVDASTGAPFQPAWHEAVTHVPMTNLRPGTIAAELQPGYTLHGRLLRPARVSVAAPADPQAAQDGRGADEHLALGEDPRDHEDSPESEETGS